MVKLYKEKQPTAVSMTVWAMQWTVNVDEMMDFMFQCKKETSFEDSRLKFYHPLMGEITTCVGDWIIKGCDAYFYSMKSEVFERIYEEVKEKENDIH